MKVTERGQVTIPKELRERFGFLPATEVEIEVRDGALQLVRSAKQRAAAVQRLYGRKQFGRSTEELMRLLRE